MKILIGADTYRPDVNGASYFAQRLATALSASHEVHVASPSRDRHSHLEAAAGGVAEHRLRSLPVGVGGTGLRFCPPGNLVPLATELLRRVDPDVVHVQGHFGIGRALIRAATALSIPVIATNHFMPENLTHYVHLGRGVERRLHRWARADAARVFTNANIVTAPTPFAAQLAETAGVPGPVLPISCGLDLSRFRPGRDGGGFRSRYGIPDRPTITYVGRLAPEKNLHELLDALALIRRSVDAQVVLVGAGAEGAQLRALSRRLGVADAVVMTGFVSDAELPDAYAASDIFCNPGTAELQSLVTLEAMASGLPVLGADASALPQLVRPGENGYLFPPTDVAALAEHALRILRDPTHAAALGEGSLRIAGQHDLRVTVQTFEELYRLSAQRRLSTGTTSGADDGAPQPQLVLAGAAPAVAPRVTPTGESVDL